MGYSLLLLLLSYTIIYFCFFHESIFKTFLSFFSTTILNVVLYIYIAIENYKNNVILSYLVDYFEYIILFYIIVGVFLAVHKWFGKK